MKKVVALFLVLAGLAIFSTVQAQDPFGGGRTPVEFIAARGHVVPVGLVRVVTIPWVDLNLGATMQFTATCEWEGGLVEDCGDLVQFISENTGTLSVDINTGLATGLALGAWTVTASLKSATTTP